MVEDGKKRELRLMHFDMSKSWLMDYVLEMLWFPEELTHVFLFCFVFCLFCLFSFFSFFFFFWSCFDLILQVGNGM